jgi:hypothetical protein
LLDEAAESIKSRLRSSSVQCRESRQRIIRRQISATAARMSWSNLLDLVQLWHDIDRTAVLLHAAVSGLWMGSIRWVYEPLGWV